MITRLHDSYAISMDAPLTFADFAVEAEYTLLCERACEETIEDLGWYPSQRTAAALKASWESYFNFILRLAILEKVIRGAWVYNTDQAFALANSPPTS